MGGVATWYLAGRITKDTADTMAITVETVADSIVEEIIDVNKFVSMITKAVFLIVICSHVFHWLFQWYRRTRKDAARLVEDGDVEPNPGPKVWPPPLSKESQLLT